MNPSELSSRIYNDLINLTAELCDVTKVFCTEEDLREDYDKVIDCPFDYIENRHGEFIKYYVMKIDNGIVTMVEVEDETTVELHVNSLGTDALLMIGSNID
jgi:peroxiredoxin